MKKKEKILKELENNLTEISKKRAGEYLQREKIQDVIFVDDDEKLSISSPSTSWFCFRKECLNLIDTWDVEEIYILIKQKVKQLGAKTKTQYKYIDNIRRYYTEYINTVIEIKHMFSEMEECFYELKARGIHMGTCDDLLLKTLQQYNHEVRLLQDQKGYRLVTEGFRSLQEALKYVNKKELGDGSDSKNITVYL